MARVARAAAAALCAVVLLLCPATGLAAVADETVDVCVVGAGPAGIGAALGLMEKGKTVALLERDDRAGGQTKVRAPSSHCLAPRAASQLSG